MRNLLIAFGLCCLASVLGAGYQAWATAKDLKAHPPPGRMVEVNGLKYHLNCLGTGSPTVILEAGLGENSLSWYPVQSKLAQTTRVCSYDRAGLGWSDFAVEPMSPGQVADNLHALLGNAGISPPYLLVGHSRGGLFCRSFYHEFPVEVSGIVLVDSVHDNGAFREYPYAKWDYFKQRIQIAIAHPLSQIGLIRLMGWANADRRPSPLPADIVAAKSAVQNRTDTARAVVNEISVMRRSLDPATPPPPSLGNLPLVVLTSGQRIDSEMARQQALAENTSVADAVAIARLDQSLQQELAALSSNSTHIVAEKSGHFIMYDQPDLLIAAILGLLNQK